jgi:hypothetical protein
MAGKGRLAWKLKQPIPGQVPIGLPWSEAPWAWQASSSAISHFSSARAGLFSRL